MCVILPFNVRDVKADDVVETYNTVSIPMTSFSLLYSIPPDYSEVRNISYNFVFLIGNINGLSKCSYYNNGQLQNYDFISLSSDTFMIFTDYFSTYIVDSVLSRTSHTNLAFNIHSDYASFVPSSVFQYVVCSVVSYNSIQSLRLEFVFDSSSFYTYIWQDTSYTDSFLQIFSGSLVIYPSSVGAQTVYDNGYNLGFDNGHSQGYSEGYTVGYNHGTSSASEFTFLGLLGAVFQAPITALTGLLNFNLLGFNMLTFYESLFTLAIVFIILRFFFR